MDTNEIRNQVQQIVTLAQTHEIDSFKTAQSILAEIQDTLTDASFAAMRTNEWGKANAINDALDTMWPELAKQLYITSDHVERNWNDFDQKFSELATSFVSALEGVN